MAASPIDENLLHAAVFDRVADAILVADAEARYIDANPAALALLGYSRTELLELSVPAVVAADHDWTAAEYRRFRTAGDWRGEIALRRRDGTLVEVEALARPLDLPGRRVYVSICRDITERKRTEAVLRESELRFRTLLEESPVGIALARDAVTLYANRAYLDLFGYDNLDEVIQTSALVRFAPECRADVLQIVRTRESGGVVPAAYESIGLRRNGSRFPLYVQAAPLDLPDGRASVAFYSDLTHHRRAVEASRFLAEAGGLLGASLDYETTLESLARTAVSFLADWCLVDIVESGAALQRLLVAHSDPSRAEWARRLQQFAPNPRADSPRTRVLQTGRSEITPVLADEHLVAAARDEEHLAILRALGYRSSMLVPLIAHGRVLGVITFVAAESGRTYSAEDLVLAENLAGRAALALDNARLFRATRDALRTRDEFLSIAAHELKTPMTSLHGYAQLLLRRVHNDGVGDPDQLRQGLQSIADQSSRLAQLIGRLLDVSRLEAARLVLDLAWVDLVPLLRHLTQAVQTRSPGANLVVAVPPTLPALVDAVRLEQVVTNLLENALKFSPAGGRIKVALTEPKPTEARLTVRDWGIGIPPERRSRIFNRFYQAHPDLTWGGLGLGLYLSRQIVEAHGGQIAAEFPPDGGTCLVVTLPTGRDRPPAPR